MRLNEACWSFQQKGGVISLPPDPPLSTSSYNLIFNYFCPKIGGNYRVKPLATLLQICCWWKWLLQILFRYFKNKLTVMVSTFYQFPRFTILRFKNTFTCIIGIISFSYNIIYFYLNRIIY